ncbi:GGDEF domain-containing protein [Streptomyces sp. NBC_00513]|uniref:GGDEF domain-containing protein n=1 Tax=unclassified Streptomyces TaxID=2593676 RepID=UPI0022570340|nr:GGDEF domain-containing protein [Streptomyces sp. NBC_00424]MCX5075609.1 GGDEF domain-containing protein [Streptomyces sp. NBC_00424]WUD41291.1 GGDEF domain-containing protein [Streptomyces sp. NBC_00513]
MDTQSFALCLPLVGWAAHSGLLTHRLAAARRDPLTGLRTRAGWTVRAERFIRRHRDSVVLLLDLDDFKSLNDTHGHAAGDAALTATAARLTAWCDRYGIAGRLGGDEFVAVHRLPHRNDLDAALNTPLLYQGRSLPVSASVGSCRLADLTVRGLPEALAAADAAMYAAKGTPGRRGSRGTTN